MYILWWIIVGLIAGWAAGKIMKGSGYGALIGGFIMRALGFSTSGGLVPTILVAILGAVVLVVLVRLLRRA
jgi:uncharacterized membrane protein YeaQ/YmgE (transglycosylase-associated protein family)